MTAKKELRRNRPPRLKLFAGTRHARCRLTPFPVTRDWPGWDTAAVADDDGAALLANVSAYACLRGVVGGTVGDSAADDSDRGSGAAAAAVDYAAWNFDALGLSETPAEWSKASRDAHACCFYACACHQWVASCSQSGAAARPINQCMCHLGPGQPANKQWTCHHLPRRRVV